MVKMIGLCILQSYHLPLERSATHTGERGLIDSFMLQSGVALFRAKNKARSAIFRFHRHFVKGRRRPLFGSNLSQMLVYATVVLIPTKVMADIQVAVLNARVALPVRARPIMRALERRACRLRGKARYPPRNQTGMARVSGHSSRAPACLYCVKSRHCACRHPGLRFSLH